DLEGPLFDAPQDQQAVGGVGAGVPGDVPPVELDAHYPPFDEMDRPRRRALDVKGGGLAGHLHDVEEVRHRPVRKCPCQIHVLHLAPDDGLSDARRPRLSANWSRRPIDRAAPVPMRRFGGMMGPWRSSSPTPVAPRSASSEGSWPT